MDEVEYRNDKLFGVEVPVHCPSVPDDVLEPSNACGNKDEYLQKYDTLVSMYIENFKLFEDGCPDEVIKSGPVRIRR